MRKAVAGIAMISLSVLSSCRTGLPVRTFHTQEAAGTVHVAVQSVADFDEEYIDQLQPRFDPNDVTTSTAIALSRVRQLEQLRDLLLQANVALQSTTTSRSKVTKMGDVTDNTVTETTTPPSLDKLPTAPTSTSGLPSTLTLPSGATPALDQALTFRAIAALKQEVALLNRFVRDAAIARGTRPYVVRLLVTLTPTAHFEPYNAFTSISLFTQGEEHGTAEVQRVLERTLPSFVSHDFPVLGMTASALLTKAHSVCGRPVEIIPLFVTDNLESSLDNLAAQKNLGVSGAASGIVQNTAPSVGGNFRSQDLEQDQGHTVNSLYTVARIADNTIEARLGAPVAGSSYEMVPRTYNVTVLALVPTATKYVDEHISEVVSAADQQLASSILPCREIAFTSVSRFEDARTGQTLTSAFKDALPLELGELARRWELTPPSVPALRDLYGYAQYQDYDSFARDVVQLPRKDIKLGHVQQTLWHDLVSLTRQSGRSYGHFSLPIDDSEFFDSERPATVFDDGTTAILTLSGGRRLSSFPMSATLMIDGGHVLTSSAINVAVDGRSATFVFPSPKKLLLPQSPTKITAKVIADKKRFSPLAFEWIQSLDSKLTYLAVTKPDDPPPPTTMDVTAPHIIITDANATGTLAVAFRTTTKPVPNVHLVVIGGYVVTTDPATDPDPADRVVLANKAYVVTLRNLSAGGKVTVAAFADDKGSRGKLIDQKTVDVIDGVKEANADE